MKRTRKLCYSQSKSSQIQSPRADQLQGQTISPVALKALPLEPLREGHFSFANLSRAEVTEFNHGLHKYPAKFIPQLVRWGLEYRSSSRSECVLDPFCGSGTTVVEAWVRGHSAIGIDISPLAALITQAKSSSLSGKLQPNRVVDLVIQDAGSRLPELLRRVVARDPDLGLHATWPYWFTDEAMARLLSIREAVLGRYSKHDPDLSIFLLVCLSAISKTCSFLSEDQIKVRLDKTKTPKNPFMEFATFSVLALAEQMSIARNTAGSIAVAPAVHVASAACMPIANSSVDRVITSPPYINAVDYTMTHKYNMFILGLIKPDQFKDHCRQYIGVTERAVRSIDVKCEPELKDGLIDEHIHGLWSVATPVSRNRAYVVYQYFQGMKSAISEIWRVLAPGGRFFLISGDNRICGRHIPTSALLAHLASDVGFESELRFYHHLANRSSMRLNRGETGGIVKYETINVFYKP